MQKPMPRGWPSGPVLPVPAVVAGATVISALDALRAPVGVDRAVDLREPHERARERQQDPEARLAADRSRDAGTLVGLADLRRELERRDDAREQVDDEAEGPAQAVARVPLQLVVDL